MIVRPTARVLALDPAGRLLLFRCEHEQVFWVTPGGGVEPGETFEQAARREFYEETGIEIDAATLGPCVSHGDAVGRHPDYGEQDIIYRDRTFLVRLTAPEVARLSPEAVERAGYGVHRWWTLSELERTDEDVGAATLAPILRHLRAAP